MNWRRGALLKQPDAFGPGLAALRAGFGVASYVKEPATAGAPYPRCTQGRATGVALGG